MQWHNIMVTSRETGSLSTEMRNNFTDFLKEFSTTVTLYTNTETKDSMGRDTVVSTVTTNNVKAEIQWVTKKELQTLDLGKAKIGDGMLFVEYGTAIDIHDNDKFYEIDYNSKRYRIMAQIEGEQVSGDIIYLGFTIRLNPQS